MIKIQTEEIQRKIERDGYLIENGRIKHRVIFATKVGKLNGGWHVHHIDGNKTNNAVSNLIQVPPKLHRLIHRFGRKFGKLPSIAQIRFAVWIWQRS